MGQLSAPHSVGFIRRDPDQTRQAPKPFGPSSPPLGTFRSPSTCAPATPPDFRVKRPVYLAPAHQQPPCAPPHGLLLRSHPGQAHSPPLAQPLHSPRPAHDPGGRCAPGHLDRPRANGEQARALTVWGSQTSERCGLECSTQSWLSIVCVGLNSPSAQYGQE